MTRGILSTIYVKLNQHMTSEDLHATFTDYYEDKSFVRIRDIGIYPKTKEVYGSNFVILVFMSTKKVKVQLLYR